MDYIKKETRGEREYSPVEIAVLPLEWRDVVTESVEDPDADNDAPKDDIFG